MLQKGNKKTVFENSNTVKPNKGLGDFKSR